MDKMPISEHLGDLRKRIAISLGAVTAAFFFSFYYSEDLFRIVTMPLHGTLSFSSASPFIFFQPSATPGLELVFLEPAEGLWMHFKISMISGFILASPVIFHQIWKFISPGLLPKEKRFALPFVFVTTFLFLLGSLFCFIIILPFAINFLLTYKTENMKPMLSVGKYVDFCMKFILAFGAVFELPVVLVFLTRIGIVTTQFLSKNRKYAVLIAFVAAAVLTPTPDAFNQALMALPMIVLYEVGIWASVLFNRKKDEE
ncbi:MAG: twin-arginine translocase subunit TatC [Nitrospirae bacterium]|nr:twin-arginine translocase subunit TatC [Nitrospirota bacterium]